MLIKPFFFVYESTLQSSSKSFTNAYATQQQGKGIYEKNEV
jgi:hypothetical protein